MPHLSTSNHRSDSKPWVNPGFRESVYTSKNAEKLNPESVVDRKGWFDSFVSLLQGIFDREAKEMGEPQGQAGSADWRQWSSDASADHVKPDLSISPVRCTHADGSQTYILTDVNHLTVAEARLGIHGQFTSCFNGRVKEIVAEAYSLRTGGKARSSRF